MSTNYTIHEVVTVVKEYRVPVGFWDELCKAIAAIRGDMGEKAASYGDAVRVDVGDDCVILSYEKSRTST